MSASQQPAKQPNGFFADVVQASQGGLSKYPQKKQVNYDAYNKLMQQLIKEATSGSKAKPQKQASARTRTKSQVEKQKSVEAPQQYYSSALPKQNTVSSHKKRDTSSSLSQERNNVLLQNYIMSSKQKGTKPASGNFQPNSRNQPLLGAAGGHVNTKNGGAGSLLQQQHRSFQSMYITNQQNVPRQGSKQAPS